MAKGGKQPGSGRPKGSLNPETIRKMKARAILQKMIEDEIAPLAKVLVEKGKGGDVVAIKELFDRAFGKPVQAVNGGEDDQGEVIPLLFAIQNLE